MLEEKLTAFVASHGRNRSGSRLKILEAVASLEAHFTVAELIDRVTQSHPGVGAATVYRAMPLFLEAGILRETLSHEGGEKVYEALLSEHHDHIVCLECGALFEFREPRIEKLQERLLKARGFREGKHSHLLYAHCEYRK